MPNTNPYAGGSLDFSDAPGGDLSFDDLFPPEGEPTQPTTAQSEHQPTSAEPQVPQTPGDEFYLKAPTGTVYKTQEEAIRGIAQKDETIERLRSLVKERLGVDPLTEKPVAPVQPEPVNYAADAVRYWNDLSEAVNSKDPVKYAQVQQKFLNDSFAPYAPVIQDVAAQRAIDRTTSEIPGFREFRTSNDYQSVLDANPILKNAISLGEQDPRAVNELPSLYKLAYLTYQGMRANEIVKQGVQAPVTPAQPARPTTSPSIMAPPPPAPPLDMRTSEGRKAIIESAEKRGIASATWKELGF